MEEWTIVHNDATRYVLREPRREFPETSGGVSKTRKMMVVHFEGKQILRCYVEEEEYIWKVAIPRWKAYHGVKDEGEFTISNDQELTSSDTPDST